MRFFKAIWRLVRSWFYSRSGHNQPAPLMELVSDQPDTIDANPDINEQVKSELQSLPIYEEKIIVSSSENIDQGNIVEEIEADFEELQGNFVTPEEVIGVRNEPPQTRQASIEKPPRLSPTPDYMLEQIKAAEHKESQKINKSVNRQPELVFDSKQLNVLLKIWVREDLLEDNLRALEGFFVQIDTSFIGVESNQAQVVFSEGISFFECNAIVDKAFKTIAINASENLGQSCFTFFSVRRELYIFKDANSCECPYIPCFDKELRPRALSSGYYWFLYRSDVTISGPRIDLCDNRLIWDEYSVVRVEISEDTETIITNKEGEIVFRLPPSEGYRIEGECIPDDDPKRPIIKGQPRIKAPATATGKVVVWLRSQTDATKVSSDWDLEKDREFSLSEHFILPFGFNQIDIIESDGTICTRHFRWLPFLDSIKYPRGIILPTDGHHDDVSIIIKKNDKDIEIFEKKSGIKILSEQSVRLSIPLKIDKADIILSRDSTQIGEVICELKRFRWIVSFKGSMLKENDPALIIERSLLDYTSPIKISFPEWITSLPGEQCMVLKDNQGVIMRETLRFKEGVPELELGVFLDTINSNPGSLYIKWTYNDEESRYEQALLSIAPEIRICRHCGIKISGDEFHTHILEYHVESCFEQLDYQSIRQRYMPDLPEKIYVCNLCGHYVKSSPLEISAITQIKHHFISQHPFKNESFATCTDVSEIRQKYEQNLPYIFTCKSCRKEIVVSPENKIVLLRQHAGMHSEIVNELFDVENI